MSELMVESSQTESGYRVNLEVFNGPLDLLLHLIRKEEVDIYEIPLARVTRQYLQYVELMHTLNLEIAGEFILMAATLIRIKTRLLLPRAGDEEGESDPREELIMALVEYRKYREAAEVLRDRAEGEEQNYVPTSPVGSVRETIDFNPASTVWDLVTVFKEILASRPEELSHEVTPEQITIQERIAVVLATLTDRESATFSELFADLPRRIIAVVTFIALLELARSRRIRIMQSTPFAELRVYRGERFDAPLTENDMLGFTSVTE